MTRAPTSVPSLSASQLAALLDELAAQSRLGIPWADALEGADRRIEPWGLEPLADQLRRGRDVREVLAEIAGQYGRQVAAVAEAGAASGRPAEALAGLAALIRRRLEYRRRLAMALVYPLTVSLFAAGLLIVGLFWVRRGVSVSGAAPLRTAANGGAVSLRWDNPWWLIPAAVLLAAVAAWLLRRRLADWWPSRLRAVRWARLAWFAELVALALEQGMPIGEAVRIAADASGDRGMRRAAGEWTAAELQGAQLSKIQRAEPWSAERREVPGLLVWTLRNGASSPLGFPEALRRLAGVYWYRSEQAAHLWTQVLPAVLLVSVAGTLAIAFIVIVLGPIYQTFV